MQIIICQEKFPLIYNKGEISGLSKTKMSGLINAKLPVLRGRQDGRKKDIFMLRQKELKRLQLIHKVIEGNLTQ